MYDHSNVYPSKHNKHGPCGKLSTLEKLTEKELLHCKEVVQDQDVKTLCYKDLEKVSITCLHAIYIFASDAFKKFGVDPKTAMVIPNRCHFVKPPMISPTPWSLQKAENYHKEDDVGLPQWFIKLFAI
ncbi:hypothetical protein HKD37_18G049498 [Glycine soja]